MQEKQSEMKLLRTLKINSWLFSQSSELAK